MKKLILIIAISCMPFLTGYAVAEVVLESVKDDNIAAAMDNCPGVYNPDQKDTDGDRIGDDCDAKDTVIDNVYDRYGFNNPDSSKRLGFGFAQPIVTIIPGYTDGNAAAKYKPVVIIAGGYDPTKDYRGTYDAVATGDPAVGEGGEDFVRGSGPDFSGNRTADSVGNAIYFLDAITGDVIARIEGTTAYYDENPAAGDDDDNEAINGTGIATGAGQIIEEDLKHSIPATITPVDSHGDGITDRIYFVDVIGNIWRLDIIPAASGHITKDWKLKKFASLGTDGYVGASGSENYEEHERRFFNQLDVVRTRTPAGKNVDAILVGSGNIADPKGETGTGQNAFFMLYDEYTLPGDYTYTPLTLQNLFNIDNDTATNETQGDVVKDQIEDNSSINGWYLPLDANEKVVSSATTIDGTAYFTTIVAGPADKGCAAPATLPSSHIYAVNIHTAKGAYSEISQIGGQGYVYKRKRDLAAGTMAFQQIEPAVTTQGEISIVLPGGEEEIITDEQGKTETLEGGSSYWRTIDQ